MMMIKKKFTVPLAVLALAAMLLTAGCGGHAQDAQGNKGASGVGRVGNDKTVYGLACDGCNDTIVIFLRLPYNGSDPDTLNILEASHMHQVFGTPRIGDKLAMVLNPDDSHVADIVIVTEDLLGLWCYKVLPTLRHTAEMEGQSDRQTIDQLPDSIRRLLDVEREYGFYIKNDSVAFPYATGKSAATTDEESLVEYPSPRRYHQWLIHDGRLVLSAASYDSLGVLHVTEADTVAFVQLTADTLVLRFADGDRGFYRKNDNDQ